MRETYRVLRRGLALLPVLVVLAACVSIPDSGSVTTRTAEAHAQRPQGYIHANAHPATPGMKPQEIAAGFLLAQVDSDLTAARTYLTAEEADRWSPADAPVTIFANETPPHIGNLVGGKVKFTAAEEGVISAGGDFTATPTPATVSGAFQMTRVAGEWRISHAPDGLYLSPNDFARNYAVYDTYFLAPGSGRLVPNPVYIPVGATQSTALVQALLDGPGPWLSPAVRTAFPPGTRLSVPSAPIRDNVVQVDLTQQVHLAAGQDLRLLAAQLAWTLGQLEDVKAVRITSDHVPISGLGDTIEQTTYSSLDPSGAPVGFAVAVVNGQIVTLDKTPVVLRGAIGSGETLLAHPAISADGTRAAALDPNSTKLYVGAVREGGPMSVRLTAKNLVTPSFDPTGDAWTAGIDKANEPAIWVVPPGNGFARQVITPELAGRTVLSLRIARDGVRAAVVLERPKDKKPSLFLGHVVRTGDTITLDGLHRVDSVLVNLAQVSWASADNIVALDKAGQPYFVEPFGVVAQIGNQGVPPNITDVTAAPRQVILASTKQGKIWSSDGTGQWTAVRKGKDPAYPG